MARSVTLDAPDTGGASLSHGGLSGTVASRSLIRPLVALKWILWRRSFRKNVGKIVGTVIGALYGAGALVGLVAMMIGLIFVGAGTDADILPLVVTGLGSVLVAVWLLLPMFAFGLDESLDPRRFAALPRSGKELQPGLFAAAAISLPSLYTLVAIGIVTVFELLWMLGAGFVTASGGVLGIVLAVVLVIPANLAGYMLCLLLPRAVLSWTAARASSRRGREIGGVLGMAVMIGAIYGLSLLMQRIEDIDVDAMLPAITRGVSVLAWTPLGALFTAPLDLAQGAVLVGLLRLVIGAVTIALVWRWWRSSLDEALREALVGDASSGDAKVTSLVPRFAPRNAFGASMGRSLRYWRRDSRYLAAIAIAPIVMIFFVAMSLLNPSSSFLGLLAVPFVCMMLGMSLTNEIGFDGPSGWVNITAGVPARANLAGRIAALAVFAVPFVIVAAIVIPLLLGRSDLVVVTLLGSLGVLIGNWGIGCVTATLLPYPTAAPGTNPMKDRSSSSTNAMISMAIGMIGVWVPQLPAIGVLIWGLVVGSALIVALAGVLSFVIGAVVLLLGMQIAAKNLDRRYVDLFQKVRAFT